MAMVYFCVRFCLLKIKQIYKYTQHLLIFKIMGTSATLHSVISADRRRSRRCRRHTITTVFKSYVHLMVLKMQLKGI